MVYSNGAWGESGLGTAVGCGQKMTSEFASATSSCQQAFRVTNMKAMTNEQLR